jgi:hypothetical protein
MVVGKSFRWVVYENVKIIWHNMYNHVGGGVLGQSMGQSSPDNIYYNVSIEMDKSVNKFRL